nr:uncharacterized protein LOC113816213 [Penaeus vannamei]
MPRQLRERRRHLPVPCQGKNSALGSCSDVLQESGRRLAVFKDANAFTAGLDYVKDQQLVRNTQIWIGATDRHRENHWKWITGQRITRVTPFWGKHYFSKQESTYDCGVLHGLDDYLMHDAACSSKYMPLCQIQ